INGSHDVMFTTVTMDNGVVVMIGGGWNLPPSFPNYCATWIEVTGTDGSLFLDDTQRDNWLNTEKCGQEFPMSTMPGEWVDHVFAGGIGPETIHFLEACIRDTAVMVTPESARRVMETYSDADLSADRNEPVDLPLSNETISGIAELKAKTRAGLNVGGCDVIRALPLPACGERVGVRGPLRWTGLRRFFSSAADDPHCSESRRRPLTPPPSP